MYQIHFLLPLILIPILLSLRRVYNNELPINKLPPELLSRIFAIGDEEQRGKRLYDEPYYGMQDVVIVI